MNFWQFLKNLFRKKTEDDSFYNVRAEHERIAREYDEWRKKEIMRSLQSPKSAEEFKREIGSESFQGENLIKQAMFINSHIVQQSEAPQVLNLQMATIGNNIKHFAVEPDEFAKLNLNEIIKQNQDNTTNLIYGLWQQGQSRQEQSNSANLTNMKDCK